VSEPTFDELQSKAAREWAERQKNVGRRLTEQASAFAQSPDVRMAPPPGEPWSHPDIGPCLACKGPSFFCTRWVTLAGVKYRAELVCTTCGARNTFDWASKSWLE